MPKRKRKQREHTEDWQTIQQYTLWPEQTAYELLHPMILFGDPAGKRAEETGAAESTLDRKADAFDEQGMLGLFAPKPRTQPQETTRNLPPDMRHLIVDLRVDLPTMSLREIAEICAVRFDRQPSHHTVQFVLTSGPPPSIKARRYQTWDMLPKPAERRLAAIRLHSEGWSVASIAEYFGTVRQTIYTTLKRWVEEGVKGLDDKSHARNAPRVETLALANEIRQLQANPLIGAWRMHAALLQMGIKVSPRTCGRIMAKHRALYGWDKPESSDKPKKEMPFKASRRHEFWSIDVSMTGSSSTFPKGELIQNILATDLTCAVIPTFVAQKRHSTRKDTTPMNHVAQTMQGSIEYRTAGQGPTLLVLNGGHTNCDSPLGHEQFFLDQGYQLLIPSRPGYGKTPSSTGRTAEAFADALVSLLDLLHLDSVIVVGISAAGRTALQLAGRSPGRVSKLILQNAVTGGRFPTGLTRLLAYVLFNPFVERGTWAAFRAFARVAPRAAFRSMMASLTCLDPDQVIATMGPDQQQAALAFLLASRSGSGFLHDIHHHCGDLSRITAPTLILESRYDGSKDPCHATYAADQIANVELFLSPAESHLFWFSSHDHEIRAKMQEFLQS